MAEFNNDLLNYINFLKKQPRGFVFREKEERSVLNKVTEQKVMSPVARQLVDDAGKAEALKDLYAKYTKCQGCGLLGQGRSRVVFGAGNPNSSLIFVGEAPGRDEDKQGVPFVGRAGQLLTKIIEAMGFKREDVFITNVVKCRPPENRTPISEERESCKKCILMHELEIIKPKVICTLGACPTQGLLGDDVKISHTRGIFAEWKGYLVLPTYHPAYLLRNPDAKRIVWEDMKKILAKLQELN